MISCCFVGTLLGASVSIASTTKMVPVLTEAFSLAGETDYDGGVRTMDKLCIIKLYR